MSSPNYARRARILFRVALGCWVSVAGGNFVAAIGGSSPFANTVSGVFGLLSAALVYVYFRSRNVTDALLRENIEHLQQERDHLRSELARRWMRR